MEKVDTNLGKDEVVERKKEWDYGGGWMRVKRSDVKKKERGRRRWPIGGEGWAQMRERGTEVGQGGRWMLTAERMAREEARSMEPAWTERRTTEERRGRDRRDWQRNMGVISGWPRRAIGRQMCGRGREARREWRGFVIYSGVTAWSGSGSRETSSVRAEFVNRVLGREMRSGHDCQRKERQVRMAGEGKVRPDVAVIGINPLFVDQDEVTWNQIHRA
ncbi:hypothetical protein C8R44DRAFT_742039 [Mycena epipterygia]|nr:hypothetical protein C8R44DRAFT_742039 [Mycena epipterygia]